MQHGLYCTLHSYVDGELTEYAGPRVIESHIDDIDLYEI